MALKPRSRGGGSAYTQIPQRLGEGLARSSCLAVFMVSRAMSWKEAVRTTRLDDGEDSAIITIWAIRELAGLRGSCKVQGNAGKLGKRYHLSWVVQHAAGQAGRWFIHQLHSPIYCLHFEPMSYIHISGS